MFGSWALIGAEQTASGYEVAWKVAGSDQYTVWATNSSGNYISSMIGVVSGTSAALEALEASFHQDLNNDGVTGLNSMAMIEAYGSTWSGDASTETNMAQLTAGLDNVGTLGLDMAIAPALVSDEAGNGGSGAGNLALFTNYLASTFVTPSGEGTGAVVGAQASDQEFLAKPIT
jgi:hypothetical protein